jgi:hypothetical protein
MRPRKRLKSVQFTLRLTDSQAERFEQLQARMKLSSRSDVFDYLVTLATANPSDQQELLYSLIDRLDEGFDRRFQALNTVVQLNVALTDSFIKYAVSALPEIPASLKDAARFRGVQAYQKINLTAVREFHRRRQSDAYDLDKLLMTPGEGTDG